MMKRWLLPLERVFFPRSLRSQLLSRSLFILSALLILIGIFQYIIMSHFLYQSTANNLRSEIRNAPPHAWDQLLSGMNRQSQGQTGANKSNQGHSEQGLGVGPGGNPFFSFNIASVAYINTKGGFSDLHGQAPRLSTEQYQAALTGHGKRGAYQIARDSSGVSQLIVLQPVASFNGGLIGIIQVGTPVKALQRVLLQQLVIFLFLALFALVIGLLTFLPILSRTLVPLSSVVDTVSRINAGNLDERVETDHGQLEIDSLSLSFNDMLDRLKAAFENEREAKEKMRRFVADASHELRTPLTSIHGFLEVLLRGAATKPDQLQKALNSMYTESERITKLVLDLLLLAQLDREPKLTLTEGSLDEVLREMEHQLRLLAGERDVSFTQTDMVMAKFDRDGIKQVILNLFQNAVQHTSPVFGKIEVEVAGGSSGSEIRVRDNGPGIPPDQQTKVFERFYRLDTDRARSHGGSGLGLAITKSIVESHGGHIRCESAPGEGAVFIVTLPP